jgi:hypothetical protein
MEKRKLKDNEIKRYLELLQLMEYKKTLQASKNINKGKGK